MDNETAVFAVLPPPQLARFRRLCQVDGEIEPRFTGYTKLVLLSEDRAFLFPRNHTIVKQLERECDIYATVDHPLVPKLVGRWDDPKISPYPFFAVTRLTGAPTDHIPARNLEALTTELGAAIAACHNISLDRVPRTLWANPWTEPPLVPPTAASCYSPLRELGGAEQLAASTTAFIGAPSSAILTDALVAAESLAPVLAHGDLHEQQFLVDATSKLTGILDWGFGGLLSPLVDFTFSQFTREQFAAEASYGKMRRHMWLAYADHRAANLPGWEQIHLALTAFDIAALAPETRTHYYWQKDAEWRSARRNMAGESLRKTLERLGKAPR